MTAIVITRTEPTDDDGTGTTGTVFNKAWVDAFYDAIDNVIAASDNETCDGRLTLTTVTPVTTSDVTAAASVYWTPYKGNRISLYDGSSKWLGYSFAETTLALGTLVNAQAYDVFAYNSSGTVTLETAEWANATVTMTIATPCVVTWTTHGMSTSQSITFTNSGGALPTGVVANTQYFVTVVDANTFKLSTTRANVAAGTFVNSSGTQSGTHTGHQPQARQTALVKQDGVLVKSGTTTRRYLGSFLTSSTTTTEDSLAKRYVFNYYNRLRRPLRRQDTTDTWTYTTATYQQANASASNQVEVFVGFAESLLEASVHANAANTNTGVAIAAAIGEDVTNAKSSACVTNFSYTALANAYVSASAAVRLYPTVGYHAYLWLEFSAATGTTTWGGDLGGTASQSGLTGSIEA